ncbi:hypothetical protein TrLO_g7420 [Triparma laevis f. longispina]|uniref:Fe2OG dioxygenase domain-containing protein n=1 Tax=Triparma laevis f. longispina TaxID=1714387 RepID=A0A9W7F3L6_9STRA|nr:hypothetical protein TrLO_g7420 [Triparma laevis f. longispina]
MICSSPIQTSKHPVSKEGMRRPTEALLIDPPTPSQRLSWCTPAAPRATQDSSSCRKGSKRCSRQLNFNEGLDLDLDRSIVEAAGPPVPKLRRLSACPSVEMVPGVLESICFFSRLAKVEAYTSQSPVVTPSLCDEIIQKTDEIGDRNGWGTYVFAKRTLHVNDERELVGLSKGVSEGVKRACEQLYGSSMEWTQKNEPHIVSYIHTGVEKEGFTHVGWHTDSSDITFLLSLSPLASYSGGGTVIEAESKEKHIHLGQGEVLIFEGGKERHRGVKITEGKRVLLVGFLKKV